MELVDEAHLRAADARALVVLHARAVAAGDDDLTAVRRLEETRDMQKRRFARARGADQGHGFAASEHGRGAIEDVDPAGALMEGAPQIDELEDSRFERFAAIGCEILHGMPHS